MNPAVVQSPSIRAVLRNGPFARYITGETISMLGTWMQQMALGWVLTGLTESAFTLGLVNFASGLPMLALALVGGVVADRYDKRLILLATLFAQAVFAAAIGWLISTGQIQIVHIVIAGVCLGIAAAFEMPAASALVPELVAKDQVFAAIAVDRSFFHATRLAGPAIGGWLIEWLGTASAFFVNAISFGALMIALLTIKPRTRGSEAEEEQRQTGIKEGILYVRRDRPTFAMIALLVIATICISPFFMVMMPLYSRHVLQLTAHGHGLLMGSSGIGALLGSIWLLSIPVRRRSNYMVAAIIAIVCAMSGLALAQSLALAITAMICLTLGTSTMFGLANTIVQERAPDYLRGRVSALLGLSFFGVLPFSGLLISEIADWIGLRAAMGSAAIAFGIAAAILLYVRQRSDV